MEWVVQVALKMYEQEIVKKKILYNNFFIIKNSK